MDTIQIILGVIFVSAAVLIVACGIYFSVFDKREEGSKEKLNNGCLKFILCIILAIVAFILLGICTRGDVWEPRHTQTIMPYNHDNLFSLS